MEASAVRSDPHVLSLSHGVIDMEQVTSDYGTPRRRTRVSKLRGVSFREGFHDYTIVTGGLRIFPRLVAPRHQAAVRNEHVSSGLPEFDALLGGGLDRGTTTLILGPAGSGKSTLALQYAAQMAGQGEAASVFAFDEMRNIMLGRAKALGLDIERHVETGLIMAEQIDPAELSPGEFAVRILRRVEAGCKLVVIDSLNGYLNAMPGEKFLTNQLHQLFSCLNQEGVITIVTLAQHGLVAAHEVPIDLSYLADTVISLRFFEATGAVRQALSVIKKRSGQHEKTIREFRLDSGKGVRIGGPLRDFQGVLTGMPSFVGQARDILSDDGQ
jgi:circadian clock protein KaiC